MNRPRFIAFYLPQYYPIVENDEWWGKGFTEWRDVVKAKKLFPGHYQPRIPADLGFYDLRMPEVREAQAALAKEAGIEGFCYWHYWFGNGKRLLEKPFNEVVASKKPDFPFCLAWANHSWYKKLWNPDSPGKDHLLIEQKYPGRKDYIDHFNALLPAFKDERYIRVNNKILFLIYSPLDSAEISSFISVWRKLASENNLNDFYFVSRDADSRNKAEILKLGIDAIYNDDIFNIHHHTNRLKKITLLIGRKWFKIPTVFSYQKAIEYMISEDCKNDNVIPVIAPNWDHSPRSGANSIILHKSTPQYFKTLVKQAISTVKNKPGDQQLIFIKSWNEWGEGNYLEPDLKYGKSYLEVLSETSNENR